MFIYLLLPRPSRSVTDDHETQLRMMLNGVKDALGSRRVINRAESSPLFDGHLDQIFQAHFPGVVEAAH